MRELFLRALTAPLFAATIMGMGAAAAHAAPVSYQLGVTPDSGDPYQANIGVPSDNTYCNVFGVDATTHTPMLFPLGSGINCSGTSLSVGPIVEDKVLGLVDDISFLKTGLASATSTISSYNDSITLLNTRVATLNGWFANIGTTTQYLASSTASGIMSSTDKVKLDSLVKVQRTRVTTDSSGNYTWTFPTAYASGQPPIVSVVGEDSSSALSNVQITSISNTSVTVHAGKITSALGILSLTSNATIPIDLTAVPQ